MPTLSEALDEAVRVHRESVAEASRQREITQRVDRAGALTKVIARLRANLGANLGADRTDIAVPADVTAVVELTRYESTNDRRTYITIDLNGITVGVELWPNPGPEHETERGFFVKTCSLCDQQIAVMIGRYTHDAIAQAWLVEHHITSLGCGEPF